jgi:hypothetical protein
VTLTYSTSKSAEQMRGLPGFGSTRHRTHDKDAAVNDSGEVSGSGEKHYKKSIRTRTNTFISSGLDNNTNITS